MTIRQSRTDRERQAREQAEIAIGSFFSQGQLEQFDHEFRLRMEAAIEAGLEKPKKWVIPEVAK